MHPKRDLAIICAIAWLHALVFIHYQRPDWTRAWTDQGGYHQLALGLLKSGQFTRYPDASPFVPETIRTPGYPLFVAAVYETLGVSHDAVAYAQSVVFVALCLLVFTLGVEFAGTRAGLIAAAATALYPPFPYFGALIMTELWTTLIMTAAMLAYARALRRRSWAWSAAAGAGFAATALCRPAFILLPAFAAIVAAILAWRNRTPRFVAQWAVLAATFALTVAPWFAYTFHHFHRLALVGSGGVGRPIWESTWQGRWSGRVQARLTDLADSDLSDAQLDDAVSGVARETDADPAPMLEYVRQWRRIRKIWTTPTDPEARAIARARADDEYGRVGIENIRRAGAAHFLRRSTRGLFVLWAADTPIRYSDINASPAILIRAVWLVQVVIVVLAAVGIVHVLRRGDWIGCLVLALPPVYVTVVHFLLLTEARQSLPAKPILLIAATIGTLSLWSRLPGASLSLEPKVHEI
jgi:Dolichyl-phosphate-mannose-protein mannosyltransferase